MTTDPMADLQPAVRAMLAHQESLPERSGPGWRRPGQRQTQRWPCGCFVWADGSRVDLCPYHDGYNDACEALAPAPGTPEHEALVDRLVDDEQVYRALYAVPMDNDDIVGAVLTALREVVK